MEILTSQTLGMFFAGCAIGTLGTILAARWQIRRSLAKARAAERRAQTAQRMAEIGALTSGLAHEIKNPLSTIGLNAQLLGEELEELPGTDQDFLDAKHRAVRRLASLRREADRLRGILTDFLNYAGELRLDCKPADLNQIVEEMADFFLPQAQQQGVRVRLELCPRPLFAFVDIGHLKQALLNLMLNAVQAMASPSAPSANGEPGPVGVRELILRTEPGHDATARIAVVHVIDTGPGMSAETKAKLFTPYFTTKAGGSGLGLPTTRRLLEAQQGRIDVVSEPGKGTDFAVSLPAVLGDEA